MIGETRKRIGPGAQIRIFIGQIGALADDADLEPGSAPAPANARVENRGFLAGIGADNHQPVGVVNARNSGIEEVTAAAPFGVERRAGMERFAPRRRPQSPALAHIWLVEALHPQAINLMPGLVGNPLLVHVFVDARQDAHHLTTPGIDPDGAADRVGDVDRLGLAKFPRTRRERIGLRGQRTNRAQIDHVALQLRYHRLLEIGRNLHVLAAADGAKLRHARNLRGEADAARALDATVHGGFNQSPEIFVLDGALVLLETRGVDAIGHGLVLQVAFAALVADRTVKRVIDEQEFHHAFAGLPDHGRLSMHDRRFALRSRTTVAHSPGAACHGLRRANQFDETHATIAGDGEAFMETEAWNLRAGNLAGLEQRVFRRNVHLVAVDDDFCHWRTPSCLPSRPNPARSGSFPGNNFPEARPTRNVAMPIHHTAG